MTKNLFKAAAAAALLVGVAHPALAQKAAPAAPTVAGIAWANIEAAEAGSAANKAAQTQRQTYYKAQIDQAQARDAQYQAQLKPLVDKFNADRAAASPNQASLQQQAAAIQQIDQTRQAELQRILQPYAYSEAYVAEQIEGKLQQAVDGAMAKRGVTLLLKPEALHQVVGAGYNLTPEIITELNTLIPSAQIVPPAGWEPAQIRAARAQQAGQAAPAAAPATTTKQPSGR